MLKHLVQNIKNKLSRSFSKFSVQSFYPTKILGAYGDSGAICTNSNNFAKKLKAYTNHGRVNQKVRFEGENSRLDNVQALVLNLNIKEVKKIRQRRMLANNYYDLLKNNKNILFPFKIKRDDKKIYYDVFQNFEILVNKRDRLRKFLKKNNIETLIQWNGVGLNKIKLKKIKTIGNYHYTNSYLINLCVFQLEIILQANK